jgi:hypothetical protein
MTLANSVFAKASVAFVALAMAFALAAPAQAQMTTTAELEALIADLTAQIESMTGGGDSMSSSVCPYTWTRTLNVGASGADVMKLQQFLNSSDDTRVAAAGSVGSAGMETEFYGPATGAAVAKFQEKYRTDILSPLGLVNATTFFGNSTKDHANALCASAPVVVDDVVSDDDASDDDASDDDDSSNGTLGNGEGSIDSVDEVSADESNLDEGEDGGVFAFTVEIEGDVEINRIDVFAEVVDSTTASDDADDYFVEAYLMVDGDKVSTIEVDDFDNDDYTGNVTDGATTDDEYRLRFSGLDLAFEDGDEPEFQVAFEMRSSLDSVDLAEDWTVALASIRYIDGEGFTDSDTTTAEETFSFEAEETAEIDITKSSDSPDATTLEVDEDDESAEEIVFIFEIEEENGVGLTIDDIDMVASTTNLDVTTTIDEVILYVDGEEVGSESPTAAGVLAFENLGIEIDADETIEVTAKVVFNGTDDYAEGDSVYLTFGAVSDARDENGNDEGDITGSNPGDFNSDTFTLRSEGLVLELDSMTETETEAAFTGDTDTGTFVFEINVSAFGDSFYMDEDVANIDFDLLVDGTAAPAASSTAVLDIANADDGTTADYKISKGSSNVVLTLTVETAASVSGSAKVIVNSVAYSADDDITEELTENATPANDWTTDSLILN